MSGPPEGPVYPPELEARYLPRHLLGQGAFGAVFLAIDRKLRREVAVKLLTRQPEEALVRRFQREARTMASVRHPNVVEVYEADLVGGVPYLVMEYLEGASLEDPLLGLDPLEVVPPLVDALEALHRVGLVHRDVKPANVFRTHAGRIVLTDFGLVLDPDQEELTATGTLLGSLGYLAPEVLRGVRGEPTQDWWALGVTLFELGEGRLPFRVHDLAAVLSGRSLPPPAFSRLAPTAPLRLLVEALLEPVPEDRPATAEEVRALLPDILEPRIPRTCLLPPPAELTSEESHPVPRERLRGGPVWGAVALVLACLGLGFSWGAGAGPGSTPPPGSEGVPSESPAPRSETAAIPWEAGDLARWKAQYRSLEGEFWDPGAGEPVELLTPSPLLRSRVEARLTSFEPVRAWIRSGGLPGDLDPARREALEAFDAFLLGQELDPSSRAFLACTPTSVSPPDPGRVGLHSAPPFGDGWLGRLLAAAQRTQGEMERLGQDWVRFGHGEIDLDLSSSLRRVAAVHVPDDLVRFLEFLRLEADNQRDMHRWMTPATDAYRVLVRAAFLALRHQPGSRDWILTNLVATVGRDRFPVPLDWVGRPREDLLGGVPSSAEELYLLAVLEGRLAELEELLQPRSRGWVRVSLPDAGLPTLGRARARSQGSPRQALLRGVVAWEELRQRDQLGRLEEALEGYWEHRGEILGAMEPTRHRVLLERVLDLWLRRGVAPDPGRVERFRADIEALPGPGTRKVRALVVRFQEALERWRGREGVRQ